MTLNLGLEFLLDGEWEDFTSHLSASTNALTYSHGRPDESSQTDPSTCAFSLVDPDGRFVEDNPRSDLFGRFKRGTLGRIRWDTGQDNYVGVPGSVTQQVYVPDDAVMDTLTARLRFTVEAEAGSGHWGEEPSDLYEDVRLLLSRWDENTNYRSWRFYVTRTGLLGVDWSTNGTTVTQVRSTVTLGSVGLEGRVKLRAFFNGTHWVFQYDAGAGYVQLGATVSGSINVQNVFVPTRIGSQGPDATWPGSPFHGKIYRATVESGVSFPNVLFDADFRFAEVAVSPLPDGTVVGGSAAIVDPDLVFLGEVASTSQSGDKAEATVFTDVVLSGASRRLNPPDAGIGSVFRVSTQAYVGQPVGYPDLIGYWPCEDPEGSYNISSLVDGAQPLMYGGMGGILTQNEFAQDDEWVSSDALPAWHTGDYWASFGLNSLFLNNTNQITFAFFIKLNPAGPSSNMDFARITCDQSQGTVKEFAVGFETTGLVRLLFRLNSGDVLVPALGMGPLDRGALLVLALRPDVANPANLKWFLNAVYEDGDITSASGTLASNNMGAPNGISTMPGWFLSGFSAGSMAGSSAGHIQVWNRARIGPEYPEDLNNLAARFAAYRGEAAGTRLVRRASESGIPLLIDGHPEDTVRMGYMQRGSLADQRLAAEKADMGFLGDAPDSYALSYRTVRAIAGGPVLEIDYTAGVVDDPWSPIWDDQGVTNDVTVSRTGGGSANSTLTEGPRSTQEPPLGSRRWTREEERELFADAQLQGYADWLLSLGTAPGSRMPELGFNLGNLRTRTLYGEALRRMRPGARVRVLNPPGWMHPDPVELVVQQVSWTLYPATDVALVSLTCTPGEPWMTGFAAPDAGADDEYEPHLDTQLAWLCGAVDDNDTTLLVASHGDLEFTEDADDLTGGCLLRLGGLEAGRPAGPPAVVTDETVGLISVGPHLVDTFTRTVASGWGTPTTGPAYTAFASGGAGSSVSSGLGILSALGANRDSGVYSGVDGDGWELEGEFSLSAVPSGAGLLVAFRMNWDPVNGNFYQVGLTIDTAGAVVMECAVVNTGIVVSNSFSDTLPFTLTAGTSYSFRVSAKHSRIRGLVLPTTQWPGASGWNAELPDFDGAYLLPTGRVGVYAFRGPGASNSPNVRFDNLRTRSPQVLTVTRGRWGWASAHAAYTPVNVRYPWRVGL